MQDHDQHDQDNIHDPDTLQTLGGSPLFAMEPEQPTDVQPVDGPVLTASTCDEQDEQSSEAKYSGGDELIEILSGVEKQIERLRGLHRTHEKKLNSIAQRSRALEEAETSFDSENSSLKKREEHLEDEANDLQMQQQQLEDHQSQQEQEQISLEQDREQLEQERKELEDLQETAKSEIQSLQQQLKDQQAELYQEKELLQQEQAQVTTQQDNAEIELENLKEQLVLHEQREEALTEKEKQQQEQHAAALSEIEQAQLEIKKLQEGLSEERRKFTGENEEFLRGQEGLGKQLEEINEEKEDLCNERERLNKQYEEIAEEKEGLCDEREALGKQLAELTKEKEDFCKEREALNALRLEIEEQSASFQNREVEFQQKQIELDQKQQNHAAKLRDLEQERESILSEKESFELLKHAELEKQHREYEVLQSDLQQQVDNAAENRSDLEDQIRSLADELAERNKAIDELTQSLEKQDSQFQQRINALQAESELLEEKFKEQESQILQDEQAASTIKHKQEQMEQLKSELAILKIKSDPDLMQRKDKRIEELVVALHQARGQIGGEGSIDESQTRVQQLSAENEQLRIQLERLSIDATNDDQPREILAEEGSTDSPADDCESVGEKFQALQAQAHQSHHQADEHDSLNANDELEKISNAQPPIVSQEIDIDVANEESDFENADALSYPNLKASSDQQVNVTPQNYLKQKSGSAKTIATLGWLTVASVIIAGMSWLAANHFYPATVSASVTFKAGSKSSAKLTNEQMQLWQAWHTNLLTSVDFTSKLSKRLADRRLDHYADANILRVRLAEDMAVDLAQPGIMTLTLAGTNKNELASILDTLATTFISESDESLRGDKEGLKTLAVGTRKQGNQVLYASLNPIPILDERLKYATYMFAVGFIGALVIVSIISRRSIKPTDIFADNDPVFVTPQR